MSIVLKYLFKSIREKKFRTLIIILSVTLSTALLFASMALSGTLIKMNTDQIKSQFGNADLIITTKKTQTQAFIGLKPLKTEQKSHIAETIGVYNVSGSLKKEATKGAANKTQYSLSIDTFLLKDLDKLFSISLVEGHLKTIQDSRVIIGQRDAQKLDLSLNDVLNIRLADRNYKLTVGAIAKSTGPFKPSSNNSIRLIGEQSAFQRIQSASGRLTHILAIKQPDTSDADAIDALKALYKNLDVRPIISQQELEQALSGISSSLMVMLSLVVVMGMFIIYTSFKIIAFERLPIIGTLRSIGANKWMTDTMLFLESALYGTLGGLLGIVIGYGILSYFAEQMSVNPYGGPPLEVHLIFSMSQIYGSITFALVISLLGSAIPILKVSKYSVKAIILNEIEKPIEKANSPLLGIVLVLAALIGGHYMTGPWSLLFDLGALITVCVGMIQTIPWLLEKSVTLIAPLFKTAFGNIGAIAVKNVSGNKSVINNIALLCLGISGMIMINTLSASVGKDILNEFRKADFEVMLMANKINQSMEQRIKSTSGVTDAYSFFIETNVKLPDQNNAIQGIYGVEPKYFDFWRTQILGSRSEALKEFNQNRVILLTPYLQRQLKVTIGDPLTLKVGKGTRIYKVAGFIKSIDYSGNFALIPEQYMKLDFGKRYKDLLYIKTKNTDPLAVQNALMKKFQKEDIWVQTIEQLKIDNMKSNSQMMLVLQSFSFISMFIGIFGLLNNIIVSILSRKQQFAVMRSVGMSKNQLIQLVLLESLFTGALGGILGALTGALFNQIIRYILTAMNIDMTIYQDLSLYLYAFVGAIFITCLASVQPAISTSKSSIIESIKFE